MKRGVYLMAIVSALLMWGRGEAQRFSSRGLTYKAPRVEWADSVMATLDLEQRIAQLMIARVPARMDKELEEAYVQMVEGYGLGGVCFFAGTTEGQMALTRELQSRAKVPLLVSMDAEWGLGMRLKDQYSFPRNARFGQLAPEADSLVFQLGAEIGRQCRAVGVHINFAPVVDINSNPLNPVIGTRAFGSDREQVARLGALYAKGLQSEGVMAVAKHFPGMVIPMPTAITACRSSIIHRLISTQSTSILFAD